MNFPTKVDSEIVVAEKAIAVRPAVLAKSSKRRSQNALPVTAAIVPIVVRSPSPSKHAWACFQKLVPKAVAANAVQPAPMTAVEVGCVAEWLTADVPRPLIADVPLLWMADLPMRAIADVMAQPTVDAVAKEIVDAAAVSWVPKAECVPERDALQEPDCFPILAQNLIAAAMLEPIVDAK